MNVPTYMLVAEATCISVFVDEILRKMLSLFIKRQKLYTVIHKNVAVHL